MMIRALAAAALFCALQEKNDPAFAPVQDDPALPRVLLIGDSISIGYTVPVRKLLDRKANVHRIWENGGSPAEGAAKIVARRGQEKMGGNHFTSGAHNPTRRQGGRQ